MGDKKYSVIQVIGEDWIIVGEKIPTDNPKTYVLKK